MADNVVTLKKQNDEDAEKKLEGFMARNRNVIIICAVAVVAVALLVCLCVGIKSGSSKKGLAAIDSIEYAFTKDSDSLSEEEILSRQEEALASLKPYFGKKGTVGTRANMIAADIYFQKKAYADAVQFYQAAFSASKNAYTAPLNSFNAGVCYEELGDLASAADSYAKAADADDFLLCSHALFSLGRVKETAGDVSAATEAYTKLTEKYPATTWADLAQSRLIRLDSINSAE